MYRLTLSLLLLLSACKDPPPPNLQVGCVPIYLHDGVKPPCDLEEVLKKTRVVLEKEFGKEVAATIICNPLHLYTSDKPPRSWKNPVLKLNGLYEDAKIHVRVHKLRLIKTAFLHELFCHRVPHIKGEGYGLWINPDTNRWEHSPKWLSYTSIKKKEVRDLYISPSSCYDVVLPVNPVDAVVENAKPVIR